jgi:hypothetical protein
MLKEKQIDKAALKLLLKYDTLAALYAERGSLDARKARYVAERGMSAEEFVALKNSGLAFDPMALDHDEAVADCFAHFDAENKSHFTDLFLSGLTSRRNDWRSGLSAFAIMQTMPRHNFQPNQAGFCAVCSAAATDGRIDLTALNRLRFLTGSMAVSRTPYEIQFFLSQGLSLPQRSPSGGDLEAFKAILRLAAQAPEAMVPIDLCKELRHIEGLKLTSDEARFLLETLGFCSILETPEHRGYLTKFTNPGLAPSKTHSSNWAYPVDFWTGKNGINLKSLEFWFGSYGMLDVLN